SSSRHEPGRLRTSRLIFPSGRSRAKTGTEPTMYDSGPVLPSRPSPGHSRLADPALTHSRPSGSVLPACRYGTRKWSKNANGVDDSNTYRLRAHVRARSPNLGQLTHGRILSLFAGAANTRRAR